MFRNRCTFVFNSIVCPTWHRVLYLFFLTGISYLALDSFTKCNAQTLEAVDSGWYSREEDGYLHMPTNTNFIVGHSSSGREYRNFFVFDLSSISQKIVAATFQAEQRHFNINPPSPPFRVLNLYNVTTELSVLRSGSDLQATFDDLGSGELFGQFTWDNVAGTVSVDLNLAALAEMNVSDGLWAFGGATIDTSNSSDIIFNGSNAEESPRLLIKVPEPTSGVLAAIAVIGSFCCISTRWTTGSLSD